jgi:hypothetical protein
VPDRPPSEKPLRIVHIANDVFLGADQGSSALQVPGAIPRLEYPR